MKAVLRKRLDAASGNYAASAAARAVLGDLECLKSAKYVAGYMPMATEIDLTPLLANLADDGVKVCLPRSLRNAYGKKSGRREYVMAETPDEALRRPFETDFLVEGLFGIPEPPSTARIVPNELVDVWLVPALAFDERGNRLGRGGGFYDRFLAKSAGIRIGVGYDCGIVKEIPCDEWDCGMDLIVTERRMIWISGRK